MYRVRHGARTVLWVSWNQKEHEWKGMEILQSTFLSRIFTVYIKHEHRICMLRLIAVSFLVIRGAFIGIIMMKMSGLWIWINRMLHATANHDSIRTKTIWKIACTDTYGQTLRCRCHIFVFVASNCCWRRNLQMIRIVYFQSRDEKIVSICVLSGRWIYEMEWLHVYGDWLVIFGWCRILCDHVGLHVDIRYFLCRSLLVSVDIDFISHFVYSIIILVLVENMPTSAVSTQHFSTQNVVSPSEIESKYLHMCGPHANEVLQFLWFKLNSINVTKHLFRPEKFIKSFGEHCFRQSDCGFFLREEYERDSLRRTLTIFDELWKCLWIFESCK